MCTSFLDWSLDLLEYKIKFMNLSYSGNIPLKFCSALTTAFARDYDYITVDVDELRKCAFCVIWNPTWMSLNRITSFAVNSCGNCDEYLYFFARTQRILTRNVQAFHRSFPYIFFMNNEIRFMFYLWNPHYRFFLLFFLFHYDENRDSFQAYLILFPSVKT